MVSLRALATLLAPALAALLIAPSASSQEEASTPRPLLWVQESGSGTRPAPEGRELEAAERAFRENDRQALYPRDRDMFELVGSDMEDNELRRGTSLLAGAVAGAVQVDEDAARERLLALFAGEPAVAEPLPRGAGGGVRRGESSGGERRAPEASPSADARHAAEGQGDWSRWILVGLGSAAVSLLVLLRARGS